MPAAIALLLSVATASVCRAQETNKSQQLAPLELELEADQQGYDNQLERFVATGNVVVLLAGGRLQADRLEYDTSSRVLWARGSVRFQRGNQYIQASEIRYNLLQGEGELDNVYGLVDLLTSKLDLNPDAPLQGSPEGLAAEQKQRNELLLNPPKPGVQVSPASVAPLPPPEAMACPPNLPPLVSRHPHPWAVTAWGGQMTDATFGETFTLSGSPRPEYLGGIGFNRKLLDADPFDIELDGNLFFHSGERSNDLRYRKGVPEDQRFSAFINDQQFWEVTFGIGLRWWIQPWLSLGVVEGVSLNSTLSNYEKVSWLKSSQFLNYLAVELGVEVNPQWSLVGRIHHRSGAYGAATPAQLQQLQITKNQKLISGSVTHWRFQAPQVRLTPEGWTAPRASFSNDPFTPAQVWVDMENVKSKQEIDGTTVIESGRNRLLLENKIPVPLPSTFRIKPKQEEEVENRWALKVDKLDRDGFFVQYTLPELRLGNATTFSLRPQFMIERAFNGTTSAYPAPGASAGSGTVTQNNTIGDLFGAQALLEGSLGNGKFFVRTDVSSFSEQNLSNATRVVGEIFEPVKLPFLGTPLARLFGAYRFRTWNGSLGEQDIYSAYGVSLEKRASLPKFAKFESSYFWRAGIGNYQSNDFVSGNNESNNFADLWRANFYGAIRANWPLWSGKALPLTSEGAYRYSGVAIVPGLSLNFVPFLNLSAYGSGKSQNLVGISGGPVITLGHFNKPMFDYTRLSLFGSLAAKSGDSPFVFDRYVDTATLGVGLTQQLVGPLVLDGAVSYNVAGNSGYYGDVTNSYVELRWQRRAYEFGFYYSPYTGIGGIRVKLNDFGFRGTGLPFVPYEPTTGVVLGP
ncbi:MAG: DUF3769 domain-containing protein [Synechococcaceae bacterium WB8_1B_057]|nr:DUF3769 domain-containing protein [Synechococcaceae bacterium WB8_1B_057]